MSTLADGKSSAEANALKAVALDHLGSIGSRIKQDLTAPSRGTTLMRLQDAVAQGHVDALDEIIRAQHEVVAHLIRTDGLQVCASAFLKSV